MSPSLSDPRDRQESVEVKLALGLFRVAQALATARGRAAAERSVSPLQLQVLIDLAHDAGGACTAGALARRYGVTAATMSDSIGALVRRRLVRRRPGENDARRRVLAATAEGRALARRALDELDELVGVAGTMSAQERARALATVVDLIRRFNELGWIRTDRLCVTCRFFERDRAPRSARPHWCRLIEQRLGHADLRIDCPEHQAVPISLET